ncbi:MAG: thioredoxin [Patescibacteria group bacterium]
MSQQFSEQNFDQEVLEASKNKPVLVDFYADWCGPCKMQAPIIDELAEEASENAIVGKLNIDEARSLASRYKVMSIPTLILFKDGEAKETLSGMQSKDGLLELIKKYTD